MNTHANAPLSYEGRRRLANRCRKRPITHVVAEMGISRACASKWVNRWRRYGEAGLRDRPSAPHTSGHLPDAIITAEEDLDPEQEALLADAVGLALLAVLDSLRAEVPAPDSDVSRQREIVDAFFAAARAGNFGALVNVLDPDIVLRADLGAGRPPAVYRGVEAVAKQARAPRGAELHPALVNGLVGAVVTLNGRPFSVLAFTVVNGKIVEIDGIGDADRVDRLTDAILPRRD